MPAGADPEAFEPRPDDLGKLRQATLLVRVGLGYGYWLDRIVNQTGEKRLLRGGEAHLDATVGIPLRGLAASVRDSRKTADKALIDTRLIHPL